MIVAQAAPAIPRLNTHTNNKSRILLSPDEIIRKISDLYEIPTALSTAASIL